MGRVMNAPSNFMFSHILYVKRSVARPSCGAAENTCSVLAPRVAEDANIERSCTTVFGHDEAKADSIIHALHTFWTGRR